MHKIHLCGKDGDMAKELASDRIVDSRTTYIDAGTGRVIHHEYDEHGSHRLRLDGGIGTSEVIGEFVHYTGVATVTSSDKQDTYMGMSEYQGEKVLTIVPCERIE